MLKVIDEAEKLSAANPKSAVKSVRELWEIIVDDLSIQLNLDLKQSRDERCRGKIAKHLRLDRKNELVRSYMLYLQEIGNVAAHNNRPQVSQMDSEYAIYVARQILMQLCDCDEGIFEEEFISNPVDAVGCPECGVEKGHKCVSPKEGYEIKTLHVVRMKKFQEYESGFNES